MAEPFLIIGAGAVLFYLLLGGDEKKPAPKPVPKVPDIVPPPGVTDADKLAAHEAGVADGYEAGLDDGSAGAPHAPIAPTKYSDGELQAVYASAFMAGYSIGYDEGAAAKKDFTAAAVNASDKGQKDGYAAGMSDAKSGASFSPNPPYQSSWNSEQNAIYQTYYMNGYSRGYEENKSAEVAGIHYATVETSQHAGVRGLVAGNGGSFKNITLMATVNGLNVEAVVLGEPRHVASIGREAMPAVVMSAGPYHGHKLVIVE